jgi:uncharacterized membrane protein YczE
MIMMLCGVTAQGMGLSLLRSINLGTDPCSCLTQGVTNFLPLSFGTCQLLCHLVTFLFVIRYDLGMIGFGTIGNMCFLGYISDFFRWGWALLLPAGFFEGVANRYILLIPSLAVFLLGAAAYMCAGLGSSPYDALPFIISGHVKKVSFKVVRMLWDIGFMAAGFLLGGDVGIVTILVAFFLGPIIAWVQRKLEVLIV